MNPAKRSAARKTTAKKSSVPAKKTSASKATAKKSTGKKPTAKTTAKTTATKTAAKKTTAKKTTAKKSAAKKSSAKTAARTASAGRSSAATTPQGKLAEYRRKRDFSRTAEPRGGAAGARRGHSEKRTKSATSVKSAKSAKVLAFVIQKHAASRLHFDLRLELDGVMKSWAVPKGPSVDPGVRRLAMEVEDHPIEYNSFEGTIPQGQYGGGTVMLWDRGVYGYGGTGADDLEGLRDGYRKGDFKFVLLGERLKGSWVLVRTNTDDQGRSSWLLIKHRDEFAEAGRDVVEEYRTSVATGRTMDEIAEEADAVWHSNRT